jgi:hypothetical protein
MNDATMYESVKPADDAETVINIFDFDGTIFNSPNPSRELWDNKMYGKLMSTPKQGGYGWYQNTLTLEDKYIVNSTFNEDVLSDIRKSMESPNTITVLLTGRTTAYSNIVQAIVMRAGLEFDEFGFKPLGERVTTFNFKTDFIKELVEKYDASEVNLWDDRIKHVIRFREWLDLSDINGEVHHIDLPDGTIGDDVLERELVEKLMSSSKKPMTESTDRKPIYYGAFLYPESHYELLNSSDIPDGWKTFAHHMTILFGRAKDETIEKWLSENMGAEVELEATHIGRSADAMAVKVSSYVPTANATPHITVAVPPDGKPFNSNKITEWEPLETPIKLKAQVGPFYGK